MKTWLTLLHGRIDTNQLKLNIGKTQLMTLGGQSFRSKWQQVDAQLQGTTIPERDYVRYPGLTIDRDLSWKTHVCNLRRKAFAAVGCSICKVSHYLPEDLQDVVQLPCAPPPGLLFNSVALLQSDTLPEFRACTKLCDDSHSQPAPTHTECPPQRPASLDYPSSPMS